MASSLNLEVARALPTPTLCADAEGRCVFANAALEALTGRPAAELEDEGWQACIHPQDRSELMVAWSHFLEGDESLWIRFRLMLPDGRRRWVRLSAAWIRPAVEEGGDAPILVQLEDLTTLHEAQTDLSQKVRTLELVDSLTPIGQWSIDRATGRFRASDTLHRLLGTEPADKGQDLERWLDRHVGEGRAEARLQIEAALRCGSVIEYTARIRGHEGFEHTISVMGRAAWDLDGEVVALFGVLRTRAPERRSTSSSWTGVPKLRNPD